MTEFKIRSLEKLCKKEHNIFTTAVLCVQSMYLAMTLAAFVPWFWYRMFYTVLGHKTYGFSQLNSVLLFTAQSTGGLSDVIEV